MPERVKKTKYSLVRLRLFLVYLIRSNIFENPGRICSYRVILCAKLKRDLNIWHSSFFCLSIYVAQFWQNFIMPLKFALSDCSIRQGIQCDFLNWKESIWSCYNKPTIMQVGCIEMLKNIRVVWALQCISISFHRL